MNKPNLAEALAAMNFYEVLNHIQGITDKLTKDELEEFHKDNHSPMTLDQVKGMVWGMVSATAEAELGLWVLARKIPGM